jgi:hypothetical protein
MSLGVTLRDVGVNKFETVFDNYCKGIVLINGDGDPVSNVVSLSSGDFSRSSRTYTLSSKCPIDFDITITSGSKTVVGVEIQDQSGDALHDDTFSSSTEFSVSGTFQLQSLTITF